MNIYRNAEDISKNKNTVISVGTFDGVHLAHQLIIKTVRNLAEENKSRVLLITFEPHPQEVIKTRSPEIRLLNTTEEKLNMFKSLNIENVLLLNFNEEFSKTTPRDFYKNIISEEIGINNLVIGYDHLFGKNREGSFETLIELSKEFDFNVEKIEEVDIDGEVISSSKIRKYISEGMVEKANSMLGYNYRFDAIVTEGDKLGKQLGFPTANLKPVSEKKILPESGVYCVEVHIDNKIYFGSMNIGFRPTITSGEIKTIEVYILDFNRDLYGEKIKLSFFCKLRDEKKFSSKEELINQIKKDITATENFFKTKTNIQIKQRRNNAVNKREKT